MRRNGWTPGRANRILTCCGSGTPLLLWERLGAGGMKPQHQQAADDTQPFKADVPQQADISIPEHLESRDMDHEPARAPETRNPLEPGTSAPEPRRRDFRYVDSRREDSDSGNSV